MLILHSLLMFSAGFCPPAKCEVVCVGQPGVVAIATSGANDPRLFMVKSGVSEPGRAAAVPMVIATAFATGHDHDEDDANIAAGGPWLGIQFGPVPKPLTIHLNLPDGVGQMILNVVKDSPADELGFEQYDVIVSFDGEDVSSDMEGFLDAVRAFEPGESHRVSYYQGGKRIDSDILVGTRPADFGGYKYEHQPEAISRSRVFGRSGMIEKDDEGNWVFGGFDSEHMPKLWLDIPEMNELDLNLDFKFPGFERNVFIHRAGEGQSVRIKRDADGKITVSRTESVDDGKETNTRTYENGEELEREDPEAYKLYKKGGGAVIWNWGGNEKNPFSFKFDGTQFGPGSEFQKEIQERIRESQRSVEELQKSWNVPNNMKRGGFRIFNRRPETSFEINDNGSIRVTVRKDGQELVQNFKSERAMKRSNPELHEKYRQLQDGDTE